ncbi:MAG TPA: exodeoxyribonuclease VII small subunit [candidate division WWE3 bacterium]|uniref:Exodeoxyribonuclease 7 small subunit n=1 Tax=candidate division WWE3 bacterium TaxID=2053526 RepID=A0A7C1HIS1_UNCKA|nr:exodeoxyribonuclease VII small subunit [candidate division WWE3 bacterium]
MTEEVKSKNKSQESKSQNAVADTKFDFKTAIKALEEINKWFQQPDIDLDEGLEKLKKGKELIAKCEAHLVEAENEFERIRDDFEDDSNATEGVRESPHEIDDSLFDFEE